MPGPLSHVRVLDLSRVLAGPWAGQNMADLGAEVIKVERPGKGDDSRAFGPPWLTGADGKPTSEASYYLAANRGKKSVTANLSHPDGQALVRELAKTCDVVIENYKFGDLARYGLGYEDLKAVNPGIIYCSVTGFGQTGPWRERPGYDFMVQGLTGLMSVTGERDDVAGAGPMRVGIPIIDILTGMYASVAICAALAHREKTGVGQHLDLALLDTGLAFLSIQGMTYLTTGVVPGRIGNTHPTIVPYQVFPTKDGSVILACGNDNLFGKFCKAAGCEHLAGDARFAKNAGRVENRAVLEPLLNAVFATRTTKEWVVILEEAGVPNGPINSIEEAFAEEQAIARGARFDLPHPFGTTPMIASPMKFSATPVRQDTPPPTLGQHTDEILGAIGMSAEKIAQLRKAGAI
ncbi:MAG: CoA transferase [Burkholderiales bacterium]|nr:CoA transferase [Burkholderiales bacterium]